MMDCNSLLMTLVTTAPSTTRGITFCGCFAAAAYPLAPWRRSASAAAGCAVGKDEAALTGMYLPSINPHATKTQAASSPTHASTTSLSRDILLLFRKRRHCCICPRPAADTNQHRLHALKNSEGRTRGHLPGQPEEDSEYDWESQALHSGSGCGCDCCATAQAGIRVLAATYATEMTGEPTGRSKCKPA